LAAKWWAASKLILENFDQARSPNTDHTIILLLWAIVGSSQGVSSETALDEQLMQLISADIATRGAPISIPAQATGSGSMPGHSTTTLGAVSVEVNKGSS
jgi:hypothetical protein